MKGAWFLLALLTLFLDVQINSASECTCTATCDPAASQTTSMPGKRGPKGDAGPKGEPGQSSSSERISELENLVEELRREIVNVTEQLNEVNRRGGERGRYEIRVTEERMSFDKSRERCIELGGDLLQRCARRHVDGVTYESEVMSIYNARSGPLWVGLSDRHEEGRWTFLDGSSFYGRPRSSRHQDDLLFYWAPGQPQDVEDCACLSSTSPITLHDCHCTSRFHAICEIPIF